MRYLYLLVFVATTILSFGQTSWLPKNGPAGGNATDVEYYPGTSNVWAIVGGRIYMSTDDGATWTRPTNSTLNGLGAVDIEITNNTIYFLSSSQWFTSTDQGATVNSGPQNQFNQAVKIKRLPVSKNLIVMSSAGAIDFYSSTNNGLNWTTSNLTQTISTKFLTVTEDDKISIIANNASNIPRPFVSTNNGQNFTEQSTGIPSPTVTAGSVTSLTGSPDGKTLACITLNEIYSSSNGGTSWTAIGGNIVPVTSTSSAPAFIEFTTDNVGMYYIDNINNKLFAKALTDAPSTWSARQTSGFPVVPNGTIWPAVLINSVAAKDFPLTTSKVVFATAVGMFRSLTGASTFSEANSGIFELTTQGIVASDGGTLTVSTAEGGVLQSTNGDTWTRITSMPFSVFNLTSSLPLPAGTTTGQVAFGINADAFSKVYFTNNNGTSWAQSTSAPFALSGEGGDNKRVFLPGTASGTSLSMSPDGGSTFGNPVTITGIPISGVSFNTLFVPTTTSFIYMSFNTTGANTNRYRVALTYSGTTLSAASATLMPTAPITTEKTYGANGKLYIANLSTSQLAVFNGTSWSTPINIPTSSGFFVDRTTGYIFLTQSGSPGKIFLSRDDGASFTSTDLPTGLSAGSIQGMVISNNGFAYFTASQNRVFQSKTAVVLPLAASNLAEVARLGNAFILKWTDNAVNETAYRILRSSDGGTNYSMVGVVNSTDICAQGFNPPPSGGSGYFVDSSVVPGATYKYKVVATNDAGDVESPVLSVAAIPASVLPTIPDNRSWTITNQGGHGFVVKPPKTSIAVQNLGNGHYSVSDIAVSTFTNQDVKQTFFVSSGITAVGESPLNSSSDRVKANGTGTWDGSKVITLKWVKCNDNTLSEVVTLTLNDNDPIPVKPILRALVSNSTSVELSWSSIQFAKNYILERSTTSATTGFTQIGTNIAFPATTITDNTAVDGTTYYYRLSAANGNNPAGVSPASDVITIPFKKPNFIVSSTTVSSYSSSTSGSFWADFDNDGDDDLFMMNTTFATGSIGTATIFNNLGTGDFEKKDITTFDQQTYNRASVADIDNDGKLDISVTLTGKPQVDHYKGNGDFTFTKFTTAQIGDLNTAIKSERQGVMWGDINNDGLLDVVLSGNYDTNLDDRILVMVQNPNGAFTSIHAGDLGNFTNSSFSTFWIDYDNNGFIDIIVSGSGQQLGLYKNNGDKTFSLVSTQAGITLSDFNGVVVADFNNDTFMDIFGGAAGGENNVIYMNKGDGTFTLNSATTVSENTFTATPAAADINNDGLVDLIAPGFLGSATKLYINGSSATNLSFTTVTTEKINDANFFHIGAALGDYNKDGFVDLAMGSINNFADSETGSLNAPNFLYKNANTTGAWVQVKLNGVTANKNGLGATITVNAGGKSFTRLVTNSFESLNSLTQHFGIGTATAITSIQVRWPTSTPFTQTVLNPAINSFITITENSDPDPPQFTDVTTLPRTVDKASLTQNYNVTITDNKGVVDATMFIRSVSGTTVTQINGVAPTAGNVWTFPVPANVYDNTGIQYYFKAHDAAGNEAVNPVTPNLYTTLIEYKGTTSQIPAALVGSGGTATGWKVIAIPFELGSNNGVQTVFDELSSFTVKTDYRMLTYTETPAPAWQDYPDIFSTIDRGVGYFINIKTPTNIVVSNDIVAPSNTRANLFQMKLKKGWNMIGNPYLEVVNWSDVVSYNKINGTGTKLKKFSSDYVDGTSLAAYEGGFVNVEADVMINIPFAGQTSNKRIAAPEFSTGDWVVPMTLKQGDKSNTFGGIGMHSQASISFDQFDDINGPRWIDFLEMNFDHPELSVKTFARDVVPVTNEFEWNFNVDSNLPGNVTMSWDNQSYEITDMLYLYDEETQTPVDMKNKSSYSFDARVSRSFKIYYGANALSKIKPAKVMLGLASPNPTSGLTTIGFTIPEKIGKMNVLLEVFDLTGRKVSTLVNGEYEAGFYSTEWHPQQETQSGMYVYRLVAGDEILGGKVILKK